VHQRYLFLSESKLYLTMVDPCKNMMSQHRVGEEPVGSDGGVQESSMIKDGA